MKSKQKNLITTATIAVLALICIYILFFTDSGDDGTTQTGGMQSKVDVTATQTPSQGNKSPNKSPGTKLPAITPPDGNQEDVTADIEEYPGDEGYPVEEQPGEGMIPKDGGAFDDSPSELPPDFISSDDSATLPPDLQEQLNTPEEEVAVDLAQPDGENAELPPDLKAQLEAPPPEIPEDIKRALATPPREVSIEEVNGKR